MSNPGVITLATDEKYEIKIEDNIGEAIHIHYQNIRLDLTTAEFEKLTSCMNDVINELVPVAGFNSYNINPKNLVEISAFLHKLQKVQTDEMYLDDLLVNDISNKYVPLKKIKANKGERTKEFLQDEQIILFGDKNFVICGQEKCKNLYNTQGNTKIQVIRLFFDESIKIKDIRKKQSSISIKRRIKNLYKRTIYLLAKCKEKIDDMIK